jgi:hypothetical protein
MPATSPKVQEDRWAALQDRPRLSEPDDGTFYALLAALDTGWTIEPPVYARPRWGSEHTGKQMYHFILRRGIATTMVSVADSPRARDFLQEQQLRVNRQKA